MLVFNLIKLRFKWIALSNEQALLKINLFISKR